MIAAIKRAIAAATRWLEDIVDGPRAELTTWDGMLDHIGETDDEPTIDLDAREDVNAEPQPLPEYPSTAMTVGEWAIRVHWSQWPEPRYFLTDWDGKPYTASTALAGLDGYLPGARARVVSRTRTVSSWTEAIV